MVQILQFLVDHWIFSSLASVWSIFLVDSISPLVVINRTVYSSRSCACQAGGRRESSSTA